MRPSLKLCVFTEPHGCKSSCFSNIDTVTFTGNAIDTLCHLLQICFWPGFPEWTHKSMLSFEDFPNVILIPYTFELLWNALHIWDIHRDLFIEMIATFGIHNWVSETLGVIIELKFLFIANLILNYIKNEIVFKLNACLI